MTTRAVGRAAIAAALALLLLALTAGGGRAERPDTVTICHAAGRAGTDHFVTLTLPWAAVYGQAGHLNENGTPRAGHEEDHLGPCATADDPSTEPTPSPSPTTTAPPSPTPKPTMPESPAPTAPTPPGSTPTSTTPATATTPELPDTALDVGSPQALTVLLGVFLIAAGLAGVVDAVRHR